MSSSREYYRSDGVKITHDPYSPEMAEKYGLPGKTDREGFDPYADTVGPGIYGGIVIRDRNGSIIVGEQYQNHNPNPGPVYAGGGYTPTIQKLQSGNLDELESWFLKYPDLVNEISTGGATPLHMCGMSKVAERATGVLIEKGADIEAFDTYGYKAIHRMASNNLSFGLEFLLRAGADPASRTSRGESPLDIAKSSRATNVISILQKYLK